MKDQDKKDYVLEINPLTKRCVTISKEHEWRDIKEELDYYEDNGDTHVTKRKLVRNRVNGLICVKCIFCGLVDDVYGGRYR